MFTVPELRPYARLVLQANADLAVAQVWWERLRAGIPPGVAGLWFGLFTGVDEKRKETRTLYVVSTSEFDADDETAEWAASDYVWEPDDRDVILPELAALAEAPCAIPLAHAAAVVRALEPWRTLPGVGVAVGYDDGDLVVLHRGGPADSGPNTINLRLQGCSLSVWAVRDSRWCGTRMVLRTGSR